MRGIRSVSNWFDTTIRTEIEMEMMIVYTYWKYTILFSMYAIFYLSIISIGCECESNKKKKHKNIRKVCDDENKKPREIKKISSF